VPFGLHWPELIVILLIAALLFGAKRLPEVGSAVGQTIKEFQKSMREVGDNKDATAATPAVAQPAQPQQIAAPAAPATPAPAQLTPEAATKEPVQP
jgi:sec-independent protein translocase protein TatA